MGYLPIIVAILGFMFLWGIVNYHSLKNRKKELTDAADLVFRYAALRQNIIIQLANIDAEDPSLRTLLNRVKESIKPFSKEYDSAADVVANEQTLSQHIDELPDQLGVLKTYRSSIEQLQKADLAFRVAANRYLLKLDQYHNLVTKAPSKFIAALTGFKKITSDSIQEEAVAVS